MYSVEEENCIKYIKIVDCVDVQDEKTFEIELKFFKTDYQAFEESKIKEMFT